MGILLAREFVAIIAILTVRVRGSFEHAAIVVRRDRMNYTITEWMPELDLEQFSGARLRLFLS